MTEERENEVTTQESEAEEPLEQALEKPMEESTEGERRPWPTILSGIIVALLALCTIVVCVAALTLVLSNGKSEASVTGTVTYRERMALPADAVVTVQIQDVSRADAPADIIGEQVIRNPGQVPIPFDVTYDPKQIDERHTYALRAYIADGSGQLLFTTTTRYAIITQGNPTQNVEVLVERVGAQEPPSPPQQVYLKIDEPVYGATVELDQPFTVSGRGAGLPEGNVVVEVLDRDGNVLAQQPTTLQGENVGAGGEGTWSLELTVQTEPGMAGKIYAFSRSPLDNSLIAEDSVEVSLGRTAAVPTYLEINEPAEGASLDISQPIAVSGIGAGLPEGNVVVWALDSAGTVLVEQATILQGENVGFGGAGTWSVQVVVKAPAGSVGRIVAFSPSPLTGEHVATATVNVTYGSQGSDIDNWFWVLGNTLPGTEIMARFESGIVSGTAGCNSYSGAYATSGTNTIQIRGPFAVTMMMCEPDVMDQEAQYLEALESATSYQVQENVLTLSYAGGVLVFEGRPVR